ncbi:hypothetical protein [Ferroacidibacillus organovorans]|uniref:Uncharacterized protein n=1 Tax=Ferroacidibacillus organovorans TaxID=1765683 RepID=A0A117SYC1_9BACL|nr:hypothetical protein [Ferroacidibacillus organovorans]KUO96723.1 hypothetical protein ATW55_07830 [Ferroacidibacillus organovorans]
MKNVVHAVEKHYGLHVYDLKWISKERCRLATDHGRKWLRIEEQHSALRRSLILDQVARHRYRKTPRFIRTKYGEPLAEVQGVFLSLCDDVECRLLRINMEDVQSLAMDLAKFHLALEGVSIQPTVQCESAYSDMSMKREALYELHQHAIRGGDTFLETFSHIGPMLLKRADRALLTASEGGMPKRFSVNAQQLRLGCDPFYGFGRDIYQQVSLIEADSILPGDPEEDVASALRTIYGSSVHEMAQNVSAIAADFLAVYDEVVGGNREQRRARIVGLALFPHEYAEIAQDYLKARADHSPRSSGEVEVWVARLAHLMRGTAVSREENHL